ncbi:MAG: antibiotic biosynthesis monooxygenase family protein [Aquaticitalea sp.]
MNSNFKPYFAVIFTSIRTEGDHGYSEMAELMEALAKEQNGFIALESAKNQLGITVSYWTDLEAIKNWKKQSDHLMAQRKGKTDWYCWYKVRICKVESEYEMN